MRRFTEIGKHQRDATVTTVTTAAMYSSIVLSVEKMGWFGTLRALSVSPMLLKGGGVLGLPPTCPVGTFLVASRKHSSLLFGMSGFKGAGRAGEGGNPFPVVNWGNRGGGGPASGAARRGNHAGGARTHTTHLPDVAAAPASTFLTFKRSAAYQCESHINYLLKADSCEEGYFKYQIVALLEHLRTLSIDHSFDGFNGIMKAFTARCDESLVDIAHVVFGQLKHVPKVPEDVTIDWTTHLVKAGHDVDFTPEGYESFESDGVWYAVNHQFDFFKVVKSQAVDWTFKIVFKADLGEYDLNQAGEVAVRKPTYAAQVGLTKMPRAVGELPCGAKPNAKVLLVEFGELVSNLFVPWDKVHVNHPELVGAFTNFKLWKPIVVPEVGSQPSSMGEDEGGEETVELKYMFKTINHQTCLWVPGRGGGSEAEKMGRWIALMSFSIDSILGVYEFEEKSVGLPWLRVKCHKLIDAKKPDFVYLTPEMDRDRIDFTTVGKLECEVVLPLHEIDDKTVSYPFGRASAYLVCESFMKKEHLVNLLLQMQPWPTPTMVVSRWGRVRGSDTFVFGNCAYERGRLMSHAEAGVGVLNSVWSAPSAGVPLLQDDFPKILLVPQDHVRYTFFCDVWNNILPAQFLNNTMPAKAMFAAAVTQLHTSKFWGGGAVGSMVPTVWVYSTAPSTGKTECLLFLNGFAGFHQKGVTMGACSSLPAVVKKLTQHSDLPLCLDEIATKVSTDGETSKKLKDIVHMCANGSTREVYGKADKPYTTFMGTSNIVVNEKDDAFMQRLLLITFKPLDTEGVDTSQSSRRALEWHAAKEFISCLQPDLEQLLFEDKLDRAAEADFADFMNKATSTKFSRNANLWGFVGLRMMLLDAMAGGEAESLSAQLYYLTGEVVKQNYIATKHSSQMNQFVLTFEECRTQLSANPLGAEEKTLHWHNYRTTEKPFGATGNWLAIRLESACHVMKKVTGKVFKPEEIRRAVEECSWATKGKAKFYKICEMPWPICKHLQDTDTGVVEKVPLLENELLDCQLGEQQCIFLKAPRVKAIVTEVDNVTRDAADITQITITSANPEWGTYNFFNAVTLQSEDLWFGYRSIGNMPFGKFAGFQNYTDLSVIPGVEDLCRKEGFEFEAAFLPSNLLKCYRYDRFPDDRTLPFPLRVNPYAFRNAPGDDPMPDDMRSKDFNAGLVDDYDSPSPNKRGRDDTLRNGDQPAQYHGSAGSNPDGSDAENEPPNASLGEDLDEVRDTYGSTLPPTPCTDTPLPFCTGGGGRRRRDRQPRRLHRARRRRPRRPRHVRRHQLRRRALRAAVRRHPPRRRGGRERHVHLPRRQVHGVRRPDLPHGAALPLLHPQGR